MYLNKAIIVGNLTRDPELKAMPTGSKVASFSIATNRTWIGKDGTKQEAVDFHNIVVFGKTAETCAQWLKKGQNALVEGRLQTRSWDGKDGSKQYRTEIVADRVQFGSRPAGGSAKSPQDDIHHDEDAQAPINANLSQPTKVDPIEYPENDINPDDIPF